MLKIRFYKNTTRQKKFDIQRRIQQIKLQIDEVRGLYLFISYLLMQVAWGKYCVTE